MDCLKAQTCITSYMEEKLTGNELKEFLHHMEECPGCREELEIYYTLLVATKQLDEGEITTSNFSQELDERIKGQLLDLERFERLSRRVHSAALAAGLFLCAWTFIKLTGATVPILNPPAVTWNQEKYFIEIHAMPFMFWPPDYESERMIIK